MFISQQLLSRELIENGLGLLTSERCGVMAAERSLDQALCERADSGIWKHPR